MNLNNGLSPATSSYITTSSDCHAKNKHCDKSQPSAEEGGDKMARGNSHDWTGVYSDYQQGVDEATSPNSCGICGLMYDNLPEGEECEYKCSGENEEDDTPHDPGGVSRGDTMEVDTPPEIGELIRMLTNEGYIIGAESARMALDMKDNDINEATKLLISQYSAELTLQQAVDGGGEYCGDSAVTRVTPMGKRKRGQQHAAGSNERKSKKGRQLKKTTINSAVTPTPAKEPGAERFIREKLSFTSVGAKSAAAFWQQTGNAAALLQGQSLGNRAYYSGTSLVNIPNQCERNPLGVVAASVQSPEDNGIPKLDEEVKRWQDQGRGSDNLMQFISSSDYFISRDLDEEGLDLLGAITSATSNGSIQFTDCKNSGIKDPKLVRRNLSIQGPRQIDQNNPPGYTKFTNAAGESLLNDCKSSLRRGCEEYGGSTTSGHEPRMRVTVTEQLVDKNDPRYFGLHADTACHSHDKNGKKLVRTVRNVTHCGTSFDMHFSPTFAWVDEETGNVKTRHIPGTGCFFRVARPGTYTMSNDGAGYVAIGSAIDEKDGKRKLVFLRHASKPSTGQGDGKRIIIVVDFKFDSDDAHDKYIVSVKEGKLKPCFSFRKANIQDEPLPASNHASLVSAVEARLNKARVYTSKSVSCRNDWCNQPATCFDVSEGGQEVFDTAAAGNVDIDDIQPFLTCANQACLVPGAIVDLCLGCCVSEKLGGTSFCVACGLGRCPGFLDADGNRSFNCVGRTDEDIADGVGVLLDESKILPYGKANICRDCYKAQCKEKYRINKAEGKRPKCNHPDCEQYPREAGGFCVKHGGKKPECNHPGCEQYPREGGLCTAHGGKRKKCKHPGCKKTIQRKGLCYAHGGKPKKQECSHEGCHNQVVKRGVCIRHGAQKKRATCNYEGCTNYPQKGGVCIRHGAKVKKQECSHEGCHNQVVKGGVCFRHGGKKKRAM